MHANENYQSERNRNENRKVERLETCVFFSAVGVISDS